MAAVSDLVKTSYVKTLSGIVSTIAASGSTESSVISMERVDEIKLVVQITCTFGATATNGMTVKCLTSLDNSTFDDASDPFATDTIPVQAGSTATKTFEFDIQSPYAKIRLENDDTGVSITGVSGKYYVPPRQPIAERP